MTLNEFLVPAAAQRLCVTVTISRKLTAKLVVEANDRGRWEDFAEQCGTWRVREIRPVDERTLGLSLTEGGI